MVLKVYEYTSIVERGTQACDQSVSGLGKLIFQRRLLFLFPLIVGHHIAYFLKVLVGSKGVSSTSELLQVPPIQLRSG